MDDSKLRHPSAAELEMLRDPQEVRKLYEIGEHLALAGGGGRGGNLRPGATEGQWEYNVFFPTQEAAAAFQGQSKQVFVGGLLVELKSVGVFNPWNGESMCELGKVAGEVFEKAVEGLSPQTQEAFWKQVQGAGCDGGDDLDHPTYKLMLREGAKKLPEVQEVEALEMKLPFSTGGKTWDRVSFVFEERPRARAL